ncbi:MAG: hypothetical protein PHS93_08825 [Candidatus Omnitrophica bacterium]|nr:hypothetical protein [Candidatus Omnitrophota bacterium]
MKIEELAKRAIEINERREGLKPLEQIPYEIYCSIRRHEIYLCSEEHASTTEHIIIKYPWLLSDESKSWLSEAKNTELIVDYLLELVVLGLYSYLKDAAQEKDCYTRRGPGMEIPLSAPRYDWGKPKLGCFASLIANEIPYLRDSYTL